MPRRPGLAKGTRRLRQSVRPPTGTTRAKGGARKGPAVPYVVWVHVSEGWRCLGSASVERGITRVGSEVSPVQAKGEAEFSVSECVKNGQARKWSRYARGRAVAGKGVKLASRVHSLFWHVPCALCYML